VKRSRVFSAVSSQYFASRSYPDEKIILCTILFAFAGIPAETKIEIIRGGDSTVTDMATFVSNLVSYVEEARYKFFSVTADQRVRLPCCGAGNLSAALPQPT
jgi:hypothetical protein